MQTHKQIIHSLYVHIKKPQPNNNNTIIIIIIIIIIIRIIIIITIIIIIIIIIAQTYLNLMQNERNLINQITDSQTCTKRLY